jgi:hypothetical protein
MCAFIALNPHWRMGIDIDAIGMIPMHVRHDTIGDQPGGDTKHADGVRRLLNY